MQFRETSIPGLLLIEPIPIEDERGCFARTWCREEFSRRGLETGLSQCSVSFNRRRGTLRGLHLQLAPYEEVKLVRVTLGSIYDVVVDLRRQSPTYLQWAAVELSARNRRQLYIPPGMAHGFQTLADDTEVYYQICGPHCPDAARGIRWDDPLLQIRWPAEPTVISARDRQLPCWSECHERRI